MFGVALLACREVSDDFRQDLQQVNGELVIETESKMYVRKLLKQDYALFWKQNVEFLIRDYEMTRLREALIEIPAEVTGQKEMNALAAHLDHYFGKINGQTLKYEVIRDESHVLNVFGYGFDVAKLVKNVEIKLAGLQVNKQARVKQLSEYRLLENADKNEYQSLANFTEVYLREFSLVLRAKHNASIERFTAANQQGFCVKYLGSNVDEDYLADWRQGLEEYAQSFFSRFKRHTLSTKHARSKVESHVNSNLVMLEWRDEFNVEIFGLQSEVDRVVDVLGKLKVGKQTKQAATKAYFVLQDECEDLDASGNYEEEEEIEEENGSKSKNVSAKDSHG